MPKLTIVERKKFSKKVPSSYLNGKRNLTEKEIEILKNNHNSSEFESWENVFVPEKSGDFDCSLIRNSRFEGFVVLGRLVSARLTFHSLELETGIVNSLVRNSVIGNDVVVQNVSYLDNYVLGDRVMLFNVQEISCTKNSKFGNGYIFPGESESERKWIGVANENDGRAVLSFENMIPGDAFLWSSYRGDENLLKGFKALTDAEAGESKEISGFIGNDVVVKNSLTIKDAKICANAYIKGASKIKNVTILSNEDEVTQIGEGVELVNGIVGYGCHVFYQAVAIRFVIGRNCQLKYGARLLNSVLGDNSTVSCCELLNNMIFPFHEQHHNSSFLIASTVMGQSNIAAGATVGSNHNSRSPDGEISAGRGFWPGLCSDFKHNSRFASFVLASKGSYPYELDVQYPFCLLAPGESPSSPVHILPAWWFMYDMFAIVRNKYKFVKRDKRFVKVQNIEMNPFAPDTMQETLAAVKRIIELTASGLSLSSQKAKDYLHQNPDSKMTLTDMQSQKKFGATLYKPVQGYKTYRKILKYFAASALKEYCDANKIEKLTLDVIKKVNSLKLHTKWQNVGGQVVPVTKVEKLLEKISAGKIKSWSEVHECYDEWNQEYLNDKTRYALHILEELYSESIENFTSEIYKDIVADVIQVSDEMYEASVKSREKDFTDYYRCMTYRDEKEMSAVLGSLNDNDFLKSLKADTKSFNQFVKSAFM